MFNGLSIRRGRKSTRQELFVSPAGFLSTHVYCATSCWYVAGSFKTALSPTMFGIAELCVNSRGTSLMYHSARMGGVP